VASPVVARAESRAGAAEPPPGSRPSGGARAFVRGIPVLGGLLSRLSTLPRRFAETLEEAAFWTVRYRHARRLDLLIVAGSNQLSDYYGGAAGFPYTLWAWSVAARFAGARVAFLSVGAGPIRSRWSGALLKSALSLADVRSYRDAGSVAAVAAIGVPGPHTIAPDLAHGLRVRPAAAAPPAGPVVINPLPYFDPRSWAERDAAVYRRYVDTIASFATALRSRGRQVRFVPTQLRADPPVVADILAAMGVSVQEAARADGLVFAAPVATFDDLVAQLSAARTIVAARFHGALLSQMLGKPTVGIVYRRSTQDLLEDVGQGAYAIDIREMTAERLLERLDALERDEGAEERIQRRLEEYREALAKQYARVWGGSGERGRG
jgi:polysaccharide pyruvyl transferase WcaK-like protein